MSARVLTGAGTPEAAWRAHGVLDALPRSEPDALVDDGPVLVVAPHPDDEVLGAGGVLATLAARGREIVVLAVTDGEGSHPRSPTLGPDALARRRRGERADALGGLGLDPPVVRELGVPDGSVAEHEGTVSDAVADLLADVLDRDGGPVCCLAPRAGDGHPDHDAVARAVDAACADGRARAVGYGVWFWHWARPDDVGLDGAVRVDLPPAAGRAKIAATRCFGTQLAPLSPDPRDAAVLPPHVLDRLLRGFEVFWSASAKTEDRRGGVRGVERAARDVIEERVAGRELQDDETAGGVGSAVEVRGDGGAGRPPWPVSRRRHRSPPSSGVAGEATVTSRCSSRSKAAVMSPGSSRSW